MDYVINECSSTATSYESVERTPQQYFFRILTCFSEFRLETRNSHLYLGILTCNSEF